MSDADTSPLAVGIAGAGGRMGQALAAAIDQADDMVLAGASERDGAAILGTRLAEDIPVAVSSLDRALANVRCWIDFTEPQATLAALSALTGKPGAIAIIGTTGFDDGQETAIAEAARHITIVKSGNFSLGVNLLAALVRKAASRLGPDWDIEIIEAHHRAKVDAPSGTALMLGEAVAAGRGVALKDVRLAPPQGLSGPRPHGGIGFAVVRGGGIVGDHQVLMAGDAEQISLSHRAQDRSLFATGALHAARWAAHQPPGLYSMADVLALEEL